MDSIELLPATGAIDLAHRQPQPGEPARLPLPDNAESPEQLLALFESLMSTLGMDAQAPAQEGGLAPIAEFFGKMLDMLHDDASAQSPTDG